MMLDSIEMTSKIIYEFITILWCFVSAASSQYLGNFYLGNQKDWNLAWKTCHDSQTRLPNVQLSNSGLQLADIIQWSPNECFWIGATYERITNYTYGTFPSMCCGTLSKKSGIYVRACDSCEVRIQFLCESDPDKVADYKPRFGSLPWINASKECTDHGYRLPSVNNTIFLGRVHTSVWWINEARILNISPMAAKNSDSPLCFCAAANPINQCSTNVKTYCMPYTMSNISSTATLQQSTISTDTYNTKPIATVTSINSKSKLVETSSIRPRGTHSLDPFSTNKYATVTSIRTTGNGALVGGLIGAAVVVVVILTIVMIVIVRRKRIKRTATDDTLYETQMIARSTKKVQPQSSSLYDIVSDDTLDMDSTITPLPPIQTVPQEPELHTQPQHVKQISINNKDGHKRVDNMDPPLYSMVQKGQREKDTSEVIEECHDSYKEYDKIEFEKRYVSESSGDMYDKATMHCLEPYKVQDANVYKTTGVCCTSFDKNECNANDKEKCSQMENLYDNNPSRQGLC